MKKSALSGELAGARTRDPNIKSVVLYLLSYEFIIAEKTFSMGFLPFRRCKCNRFFCFTKIKRYFCDEEIIKTNEICVEL